MQNPNIMSIADLTNSCRICLSNCLEMHKIFNCNSPIAGSDDNEAICDKILFCTSVQMTAADGLPTHICDPCLKQLFTAFHFKTTCIENAQLLQKIVFGDKILEELKNDSLEVYDGFETDGLDECVIGDDKNEDLSNGVDIKKEIEDDCAEVNGNIEFRRKSPRGRKRELQSEKKVNGLSKPSIRNLPKPVTRVSIAPAKPVPDKERKRARPLYCEICEVKFPNKASAVEHRKTHKSELSRVCEFCGKVFEHRSSHYVHLRSHLPPQFACDQCDYRTWHKHDLVKHTRTHSGQKQFQCEFCTAAYHASSNLRSHIRRSHQGQKNFACPICPHRFFDKSKLRQHVDAHNDIKRYNCELCGTALSRRNYWARHMQRQHGITVEPLRPGPQKINYVIGEDIPNQKNNFVGSDISTQKTDYLGENISRHKINYAEHTQKISFVEDISAQKTDYVVGNVTHEKVNPTDSSNRVQIEAAVS